MTPSISWFPRSMLHQLPRKKTCKNHQQTTTYASHIGGKSWKMMKLFCWFDDWSVGGQAFKPILGILHTLYIYKYKYKYVYIYIIIYNPKDIPGIRPTINNLKLQFTHELRFFKVTHHRKALLKALHGFWKKKSWANSNFQNKYTLKNYHGTWKWTLARRDSFLEIVIFRFQPLVFGGLNAS